MSRPIVPEQSAVPSFQPDLERDIDAALEERLGRTPTNDERTAYREFLWALAVAIREIVRAKNPPSPPPPCPAPPSTRASRASRTIAKS